MFDWSALDFNVKAMCDHALRLNITACKRVLRLYPTNPSLNSWFAVLAEETGKRGGWR